MDINSRALKTFTNRLAKMGRNDLPGAIRYTLTNVAKDVKMFSMPRSSNVFVKRRPNFFKANSTYIKAEGIDISRMVAIFAFNEHKLTKPGSNYAVRDLEEQEWGGDIGSKAMIPLRSARISSNDNRPVKVANRLSNIENIVDSNHSYGKSQTKKGMFEAATKLAGRGGYVKGNILTKSGANILWRVDQETDYRRGDKKFSITPLYSVKKGRSVNIDKDTHFVEKAAKRSIKMADWFFIKNAEARILRTMKL